jgi:hypothetical protein
MVTESNMPPLPDQFPHIFVDIAWPIIPEAPYGDLVYLSQLVKQAGREKAYEPLVDCLRKIQWAKLAGQEAIFIESRIAEQVAPETIIFDPVGQVQHQKSLFDFIANGKASLDSLAVFLNCFLNLGKGGGDRDFRKVSFCQAVFNCDNVIGIHIKTLVEWLDKERNTSDSIVATRDEWLHRGRPAIALMYPPNEIGCLPVPKALTAELLRSDTPNSGEYYWKTQEFIDFHLQKLFSLFLVVVKRCINIEENKASKPIRRDLLPIQPSVSALPMKATKNVTITKMKLRS